MKKFKTLLAACVSVAILAGCGSTQTPQPLEGPAAQTATPAPAAPADTSTPAEPAATPAKDSVTISLPGDISNLDPANSAAQPDFVIFSDVYNRLVDDNTGEFLPELAESWELAADELSYTLNIRKGVKFHNGEELKASDVVFTLKRAMESPYTGGPLGYISDVTATDDYTVVVSMTNKHAPYLASLHNIYVVNEKAITEGGENYAFNPVGTGPYKWVGNTVGQEVKLTRNDEYFKGVAPIKDLTYKIIINTATASIAVESGDIDMASLVNSVDLERLESNSNLKVLEIESKSLNFMLMNPTVAPFDNKDVRLAVAHAIDKEACIVMAVEGHGTVADSVFNKYTYGYSPDVKGYPYDIAKAKEYLKSAGMENGFDVTFKTIPGPFQKQAEAVQASLAEIGINVTIEMMEQNAYINDVLTGNYSIGNLAIALGNDASDWAPIFESTGGMNFTMLNDPEVDAAFAEGGQSSDEAVRLAAYKKVAEKVHEACAFIPLYFMNINYVLNKDLELGHIDANGVYDSYEVHWK